MNRLISNVIRFDIICLAIISVIMGVSTISSDKPQAPAPVPEQAAEPPHPPANAREAEPPHRRTAPVPSVRRR